MAERNVLIVGLDPDRVDFSLPGYGGASAKGNAAVKAAPADGQRTLEERGYRADLCMVVPDGTATSELEHWLGRRSYSCVVFGAGLRCPPAKHRPVHAARQYRARNSAPCGVMLQRARERHG